MKNYWFEIHITVDYSQKDDFVEFCKTSGIKTIDIDMGVMKDIMTATKVYCTKDEACMLADIYAMFYSMEKGFDIKRVKVEAENEYPGEYLYIESHLKFDRIHDELSNYLISNNTKKPEQYILTLREKDHPGFYYMVNFFVDDFVKLGMNLLEAIEIEKVVMDTNPDHDILWTGRTNT
ncbi:MAG: hypothetical protein WC679_02515 [Bacteroidales bacterium]|jgi:hypothetical protein